VEGSVSSGDVILTGSWNFLTSTNYWFGGVNTNWWLTTLDVEIYENSVYFPLEAAGHTFSVAIGVTGPASTTLTVVSVTALGDALIEYPNGMDDQSPSDLGASGQNWWQFFQVAIFAEDDGFELGFSQSDLPWRPYAEANSNCLLINQIS
jgi:hypothetical protein